MVKLAFFVYKIIFFVVFNKIIITIVLYFIVCMVIV